MRGITDYSEAESAFDYLTDMVGEDDECGNLLDQFTEIGEDENGNFDGSFQMETRGNRQVQQLHKVIQRWKNIYGFGPSEESPIKMDRLDDGLLRIDVFIDPTKGK